MKMTPVPAVDAQYIDAAARQSGELAIGCTDAAGQIRAVADSIAGQTAVLEDLRIVLGALEADQRQVAHATAEANAGAVLTDRYGPTEHTARLRGNTAMLDTIAALRAKKAANA